MRNTACRKREIFKKPECCHRYYEFGSLMICVWRRHEESCIVLFDQHAWRSFLPFYIKDVISLFWAFKLNISDVFKSVFFIINKFRYPFELNHEIKNNVLNYFCNICLNIAKFIPLEKVYSQIGLRVHFIGRYILTPAPARFRLRFWLR